MHDFSYILLLFDRNFLESFSPPLARMGLSISNIARTLSAEVNSLRPPWVEKWARSVDARGMAKNVSNF